MRECSYMLSIRNAIRGLSLRRKKRKRKDTGYSTASSQNLYSTKAGGKDKKAKKSKRNISSSPSDCDLANAKKQKRAKNAEKAEKK